MRMPPCGDAVHDLILDQFEIKHSRGFQNRALPECERSREP